MRKYQALVIGAGPSGSTAAFFLAKQGIDAIFIDKETWPRDKVCGDGQMWPVFPLYKEMGIYEEAMAAAANTVVGHVHAGTDEILTEYNEGELYGFCTPRRIIDDLVRKAAIREGAEFLENCEARGLIIERGVVKGCHALYNNKMIDIRADIVILANGSHSMEARQLGIFNEDPSLAWYGARGYFENIEGMYPDKIEFYYPEEKYFPAGYIWIFPEDRERNIGNVGIFLTQEALEKEEITVEDYIYRWRDNTKIGAKRLGNAKLLGEIKGWKLPSCRQVGDNYTDGALLIGDAGSGVECFMGEGFPEAMFSGKCAALIAAEAIQKGDTSKEFLAKYKETYGEQMNSHYAYMAAMRDYIYCDGETLNKFLEWVRNKPGYPNNGFGKLAMEYMTTVLKLDLGVKHS